MTKKILGVTGQEVTHAPKITAIKPFGSKILVEVLNPDEAMGTTLYVAKETKTDDAPQAYIVQLGPQVSPDAGLKVGQRILWTGKGTAVNDPQARNGRLRALLEIHNVLAICEE